MKKYEKYEKIIPSQIRFLFAMGFTLLSARALFVFFDPLDVTWPIQARWMPHGSSIVYTMGQHTHTHSRIHPEGEDEMR